MQEKQLQRNAPAKKPMRHNIDIIPSEKPRLSEKEQERLNDNFLVSILMRNNKEILQLVGGGADISVTDKYGWTALHIIVDARRDNKIFKLMVRKYLKTGGDAKQLVAAIAAKGENGWTALHLAANNGNTEICEFIIREYKKLGGRISELMSMQCTDGIHSMTAKEVAAKKGHIETLKFLGSVESTTRLEEIMGEKIANSFMKSLSECLAA